MGISRKPKSAKKQIVQSKESDVTCKKCQRKFIHNGHLRGHDQTAHGNKVACTFCKKIFDSKLELAQHKLTHIVQCEKCKCTLSSRGNLKHHMENTHAQKRRFHCKLCPKRFKDLTCLNTHMKSHFDYRPYKCNSCGMRFKYSNNLTEHRQTHTREKYFPCYICEKIFTNVGNMKRHMAIHTGDRPFSCNLCNASFQQKYQLQEHNERHENKRNYKCDICEKAFSVKRDLTHHKTVVHTPLNPYFCDLCGKTLRHKIKVVEHIASHVGNRIHKCSFCGEGFIQVKSLTVHKRKHTGYRMYQCDLCDEILLQKKGMQKHRNRHLVGKFLCCIRCKISKNVRHKQKFANKEELKAHMIIHRQEKRLTCDVCSFSTDRTEHINRHMRSVHRRDDTSCCKFCHKTFPTKNCLKRHFVVHIQNIPDF